MSDLSHTEDTARRSRHALLWLAVIIVVAAALRLYALGWESLWNDELSRWHSIVRPSLVAVAAQTRRETTHPPGFYYMHYVVIALLGDSEWALR